jgi:hypothetical protein
MSVGNAVPAGDLLSYYTGLTAGKIVGMKGRDYETHILECKGVTSSDLQDPKSKFKDNVACSLSGFANAGGGVVIWGVTADRDAEGIDRVTATKGLVEPDRLVARLWELTPMLVTPSLVGVEHRLIRGRSHPSFVATLIPQSDAGPHMCMTQGPCANKYYVRSGASFMAMQHHQIADMFGRRARPVLDVQYYPSPSGEQYNYGLRIMNRGRGAAQAPFIQLNVTHPFVRNGYGVDGNRNDGLPFIHTHRGEGWLHAGGMNDIIHPSMFVDLGGVYLGHDNFAQRVTLLKSHCIINFKVGALGIPPVDGKIEIPLK